MKNTIPDLPIEEEESQEEVEKVLTEASLESLLSDKEYNQLIQEVEKTKDIRDTRNKIFAIIKTAEEATKEYAEKMNDGLRKKALTKQDLEEGMKFFKESDVETKKNIFVATADERLDFAKNQLENYLKTLEDNRNLFNTKELKNLEKSFLGMSSIERGKEDERTLDLIKERQVVQNSYKDLLGHELIDDQKNRLEKFEKLSFKDRKKEIKALEEKIKSHEKSQVLIRKETDASKNFCKIKNWKSAIPHCKKALKIINKLNYKNKVEWFSHRHEVITDLVNKLEEKIAKNEQSSNPKALSKTPSLTEESLSKDEVLHPSPTDISEKRKNQLTEMLIKGFVRSKKASATTISAFAHSSGQETVRDNQKNVDSKSNLAAKDHETKNNDNIIRLESRVENMSREKISAMAYKQEFDQKTIAIVNTDNRILSKEEGDQSVNRNLEKVLLEEIKNLSISTEEKEYLRSSARTLNLINYGRKIRSDSSEGLNKHESKLGKDFEKNKSNFAHDLVNTAVRKRKKVRKTL